MSLGDCVRNEGMYEYMGMVGDVGTGGGRKRTLESTVTVSFLCLHLLVDKPERVLIEQNHQNQRSKNEIPWFNNARYVRGSIQGYTAEIESISMARGRRREKLEVG